MLTVGQVDKETTENFSHVGPYIIFCAIYRCCGKHLHKIYDINIITVKLRNELTSL